MEASNKIRQNSRIKGQVIVDGVGKEGMST